MGEKQGRGRGGENEGKRVEEQLPHLSLLNGYNCVHFVTHCVLIASMQFLYSVIPIFLPRMLVHTRTYSRLLHMR